LGARNLSRVTWARIAQVLVRLFHLAAPDHLDGVHLRASRAGGFVLYRLILVERFVACGVRLHIADVAPDLALMAGLDQAHVAEPALQSARDIVDADRIAVDDKGKHPPRQVARKRPTGIFDRSR